MKTPTPLQKETYKRISMLRQWINEKPKDHIVTNGDIETWLELDSLFQKHLEGKVERIREKLKCPEGKEHKIATHSTDSGFEEYCSECFINNAYLIGLQQALQILEEDL